jgi:hypothetical protein
MGGKYRERRRRSQRSTLPGFALVVLLGCSEEATAPTPSALAGGCSWRVEYSSYEPLDDPRARRLGGVVFAGDEIERLAFIDGPGAAGDPESFDAAEIELGAAASAKLAALYAELWDAPAPLAGRAVVRLADTSGERAKLRLIFGHPVPIRILRSGDHTILRMPLVEGSLARFQGSLRDGCK